MPPILDRILSDHFSSILKEKDPSTALRLADRFKVTRAILEEVLNSSKSQQSAVGEQFHGAISASTIENLLKAIRKSYDQDTGRQGRIIWLIGALLSSLLGILFVTSHLSYILPTFLGLDPTNEVQFGGLLFVFATSLLLIHSKARAASNKRAHAILNTEAKRLPSMGLAPVAAILIMAATAFLLVAQFIPLTDVGKAYASLKNYAKKQELVDNECRRRNLTVGERLDWSLAGVGKFPLCYEGLGPMLHVVERYPELRNVVRRDTALEASFKAAFTSRIQRINAICDRLHLGRSNFIPDSAPEAIEDRRLQQFRCYSPEPQPQIWLLKS